MKRALKVAPLVVLVSLLVALVGLTLLWVPAPLSQQAGTTRYVNRTDPTCGGLSPCYATIQAAVHAAQTGDTIQIQAGSYREQVTNRG